MNKAISLIALVLMQTPFAARAESSTYAYTPLDAAGLSRYCLGAAPRESDSRAARGFCQGFVLGAIEALQPSSIGRPGVLHCEIANQIAIIARISYYAEKRVAPPSVAAVAYVDRIARELCAEAARP